MASLRLGFPFATVDGACSGPLYGLHPAALGLADAQADPPPPEPPVVGIEIAGIEQRRMRVAQCGRERRVRRDLLEATLVNQELELDFASVHHAPVLFIDPASRVEPPCVNLCTIDVSRQTVITKDI